MDYVYFLLGAVFVTGAIVAEKKGGRRSLIVVTGLTVVILFAIGLVDWSRQPRIETEIGFPILLALLSPALTAGVIWVLNTAEVKLVPRWFLANLAWAFGLLVSGVVALSLNWVTI